MCIGVPSATGFPVLDNEMFFICLLMLFASILPNIVLAAGFTVLDVRISFICVLMIFMSNLPAIFRRSLVAGEVINGELDDAVLMYNDSTIIFHKLCRIPRNCQCK